MTGAKVQKIFLQDVNERLVFKKTKWFYYE